ncbi:hypothetical protein [Paludibacterium purpuratum]|uniref:STAS/SEC14 domain-containing protein n=1 Tax=Paludibacterium purpuratum TaxID=1144873 RepID=A0A4R7BGA9_9NEIS|nr:hypothetical protein [Paludibacterium purpuratum]TDR82797.1 hypothetical protein DFP86_101187 [Paludibacterium purpuratum]
MTQGLPAGSPVSSRCSGAVAWLYVEGPWDAERVRLARDHFEETRAVHPLPTPWGLIVVVLGSTVCVPEALLALRAAARQDARMAGRVATAWVMAPGLEGRSIMPAVLHTVYQDICPLAVCANEADAEHWLQARLAEHTTGAKR